MKPKELRLKLKFLKKEKEPLLKIPVVYRKKEVNKEGCLMTVCFFFSFFPPLFSLLTPPTGFHQDLSGSAMLMGLTPNNSYPPIPIAPSNHQLGVGYHPHGHLPHHQPQQQQYQQQYQQHLFSGLQTGPVLAQPQQPKQFADPTNGGVTTPLGGATIGVGGGGGEKLVVASNLVEMLSQRNLQQTQAESGHAVGFLPFYGNHSTHKTTATFLSGKAALNNNLMPAINPRTFFSPEERRPPFPPSRNSASLGLLRPFFSEPIREDEGGVGGVGGDAVAGRRLPSHATEGLGGGVGMGAVSAGVKRGGRELEGLEREVRENYLYGTKRVRSNPSAVVSIAELMGGGAYHFPQAALEGSSSSSSSSASSSSSSSASSSSANTFGSLYSTPTLTSSTATFLPSSSSTTSFPSSSPPFPSDFDTTSEMDLTTDPATTPFPPTPSSSALFQTPLPHITPNPSSDPPLLRPLINTPSDDPSQLPPIPSGGVGGGVAAGVGGGMGAGGAGGEPMQSLPSLLEVVMNVSAP